MGQGRWSRVSVGPSTTVAFNPAQWDLGSCPEGCRGGSGHKAGPTSLQTRAAALFLALGKIPHEVSLEEEGSHSLKKNPIIVQIGKLKLRTGKRRQSRRHTVSVGTQVCWFL